MSRTRVAVLGAGSIAGVHLRSYARDPRAKIEWVFDKYRDRAEQLAAEFGARGTDDLQEVLGSDVDAVSICTWNDTHAELAIAALAAGKHVLVEKPVARTVSQARALEEAVAAASRHLEVGFVRRHSPNAQLLKRFIDAGELGDIYYARASFLRRAGNPGGWFADRATSGGGPLIDIGVHVIDLCWYLMGTPTPVTASASAYSRLGSRGNIVNLDRYRAANYDPDRSDVEDLVGAFIRFENGSSMMLETSYSLHAPQERLEVAVYGDAAGAELEPSLIVATERHDTLVNVVPQMDHPSFDFDEAFANEIASFISVCRDEKAPVAPVQHGIEVLRMVEGVYESARTAAEVAL